jgi:two-component system NarL family response regulator
MKILLVDDHPLFIEGLRNLLASEGIEVIGIAHDGFEALFEARRLHPDVILMDVQMPQCDGVAATRLIKAEMPEIKIVMLTMSEDEQNLFDAVKSGASGYLLKRLDAERLFEYLTDLNSGHPPFSPGLANKLLDEFARLSTHPSPSKDESEHSADAMPDTGLSTRQTQILTLVAQGQTYKQVAQTIGIGERTVKYHMAEILERLHLQNRTQVIAYATKAGLVPRE